MKKPGSILKTFVLVWAFAFSVVSTFAADRYSVATGNWNANSTWSATSGGAPGASFPVAGDNAFIEGVFTVTITANAACANLSVANGSVLTIGGFNLTVSGTTALSGTINHSNVAGTKIFTGLVTINAGGIWDNSTVNAPIIFRGGITNNETFNAGTGTYTFNTNNQALIGTFSIPNVTATGITLTNNGTLVVGTALSGTGGLSQGVNATLDLGGTSAITTLTASNSGNTVNFSGAAQSVNVSSYYNLTISGSGNKTMSGNVAVSGTLTLTAGTFTVGANTLTLNGPTIAGTPANLVTTAASSLVFGGTSAGVLIPTSVVALNGLSITNTSIVTLQSSPTVSGTFNPAGAGLSIGANTLTLNGQINCGTLVGGATSNIIIGVAGTASLPGVTLNNLTVNRAAAMCGNVTVGGTLTLTSGVLSIAANTLTLSDGANLSYGGGTLTGGATSNFTVGTGTAITLNTISGGLNNFNTSRNITLGADLTVSGTLTLQAGTFTVSNRTLTLNGPTIAGTPANLATTASSSLVFGGTAAGVLIPTSVIALNNLSISNTSIVTLQSSPTVSGTFTPGGGGLSIGANTLTLNGPAVCGTLVGGAASNIIIGGAGAANIPGVTLNNLTLNKAAAMCGNVTVGGTLALNTGALSIAANSLTLSNGANLSYGGGTLTGGATSNFTIGTGTDITLNSISGGLNNFNTSRNITLGADLTVNGTLTLTAGTFTVGPRILTLNGPTIAGTPGNLTTSATSNLSFGGSSAGVFIPASVTNLNNLTINNINGVTLTGNITLAAGGVLTLTSGIVQAGTNILKITNTNPATAIIWSPGTFVNVTSGAVERTLTANLAGTGNNYLFPIGEGGVFKGINLRDVNTGSTGPVLRASVNATGALTGDGTTIGPVDPRYWSLLNLNSGNLTSAKVELYENGLDFSKTIGMSSAVAGNYTAIGGSSNASSIISPTVLNPGPYFCIGASILDIYYSFQAGDWNTPTTWTSDPSGTLQSGTTIPGDYDKVVILSDRTVTLPADITTQNLDITIDAGGFLDQSAYRFTNSLYALRGQGTIKLASVNFPASVINTFVNTGGGTTEYNNTADFTLPVAQTTYNNLTINTSGFVATQLSNITLNANLYVKSGTFQINNNVAVVKLNLTINGNVTVDNGGFISVGNGPTNPAIGVVTGGGVAPFINYYTYFHTVIIKGNFTNNGTIRFTNLPYPIYNAFPPTTPGATSGAASVYFQGASDNTLNCYGITTFYNLVVDKGIDQTFKLTINSTNYSYFRLFGANVLAPEAAGLSDPNLRKALWIRTGTVVLKGSMIIPSLSEGIVPNADYYIPFKGALMIDGVDVVVLSSADDYREINVAYTVAAPDNATIGVTRGGLSAVDIFGKLQINDGYLSTRESGGLITSSIASGQLIINDGTVDAKQLLSSTGSASFTQTGGLFILRGRFQRTPAAYSTVADLTDVSTATLNTSRATNGINTAYGSFNLEQATNIFAMSGGTIRIYDVCGIGALEQEAFDVKSSPSNINVTGGTVEIKPVTGTVLADAGNYFVSTTASLYDLIIDRISSASVVQLKTSPLVVLNDLMLSAGDFAANNLNVSIGRDFYVAGGTSYTTGNNTTVFNGDGEQVFTVDLAAPLSLNKLTIDKPAGTALSLAGAQSTINVSNDFSLVAGSLNDNGKTINVAGNVYNSGIHGGAGRIVLNGTLPQSVDGNGVFGNLELNNTNAAAAPVSLIANITVNGTLNFAIDKLLNIGTYNLKLNASASILNGGASRYIQTAGNAGDGGVTKVFASTAPFTFPLGAPTITPVRPVKYTPATIGFSTPPAGYGSITVNPVGYEHPNTTTDGQSLTYFWRIKSSGFSGITANSVIHSFMYDQSDVVGAEINYVPSLYTSTDFTWKNGTNANPPINITNNTITDWTTPTNSADFIDADYTAGDASFGSPLLFYSIANSPWNLNTTWSYTSGGPAVPAGAVEGVNFPGPNSIVIIENNHTVNLTTNQKCASLQIQSGSTLDIYTWTGSIFSMVLNHPSGNGLFRLTTTVTPGNVPKLFPFPINSDFSDFNNNHGTTEYYDIDGAQGAVYILPANVTSYGNLILTARGGDNLVLPNNALTTIQGDLTCGGDNPFAWIAVSWNTNVVPYNSGVYNPTIEKTIHVTGNVYVNNGTLIYMDDYAPQHLVIDGDMIVAPIANVLANPPTSGYYNINGAPQANTLAIGGSLFNNTNTGNSIALRNVSNVNGLTYYCDVTFFGSNNSTLSNTSGTPTTIFNKVTVNKGTSQATTLTCDIAGTLSTPVNNWLTLQNGTFRYMRTNPGSDFTISTTTPFNIPATAGLYIDYSNSGARNILIGNSAVNNNDLILDGKLTVINGNVYVGPVVAPANNNDIEYSGSGASALEVQGGNLVVNGQIRRNTSTTNGILNYTQSGGTVTTNGNGANASYAKLEVLNPGSAFKMSGGTITIVRGGGTTYGDLYIRPDTSSVTGGTIIFTNVIPNSLQNYSLDANIPLNNLTITGAGGAGLNANLSLIVSPLVLNGTFTLSNPRSIFNSNNINVSVKGNLDNSGTYNYGTNITTFDGGVQIITGSSTTNFNNLNVLSLNSLTVNNNFSVGQDLFIGSGNLILGNKKVTLLGNLTNNGSYTDDNTVGGISISGTIQQQISGTGSFGRIELNTSDGAKLMSDINIQNNLVLTLGVLDINKYLLTLGQNSLITGSPFGSTKMIKTNGVISDLGVRKFFTASPQSFTFPVGVSGKYTPVIYSISANATVGYINVNPINSYHPSVTDPSKVLNYYWLIESSGITGFDANVLLQYMPGDVFGIESDYVAAKLIKPGNFWYEAPYGPATDNVDEANNQITFSFTGSNSINGEYTAGINTAIPGEIPTYQSNRDGNWSDETIWTPVGPSPPCQPGGPIGANVIIDHVVTIDINKINSYSTTINNRLRFPRTTFGHSYGFVSGNGTLYLEEGNLPAGSYTTFTNCSSNSTIEYGGIGNYSVTIIASLFSSLPNLFFTGTGTRVLPDKDLTICKRLVIDGPILDNSVNNQKLTILGSMEIYNTGIFHSGSGDSPASTVSFSGTAVQSLCGPTGNFSGENKFNNLEINNPAGLNIGANGLLEVKNQLLLTNGIIGTSSTSRLILLNTSSEKVIPAGGKSTSFINGPLTKQVVNGDKFLYPIGKGAIKGHNFTLKSGAGSTLPWTVEYFTPNPTSTSLTPPLIAANKTEYWSVSTNTASKAKVIIGWDPMSDLTPLMTENGLQDMRVAEYISGSWNELQSQASGNNNNGEVVTVNKIDISTTPVNFTSASVTQVTARASFSSSLPACGSAGIPVSFTYYNPINLNYTLTYTINNVSQPIVNITSLPYTLPTPVPGAYKLTAFTYNNGLNNGVVNSTVVNVYADPPIANAGPDQSLCGISGTILAGTNPAPYSGQWTAVSGSGGTFINSTQYNSVFTGVLDASYTLRWTISNVSCTSADEVIISFPVVASTPGYFTSAPTTVCQSSGGHVYTVPNVSGNTYNWTYDGTGHTINGTGNSVTVDFNATATSGTLSVTATNACGTSAARTVNIIVTPFPVATFSYDGTPYCQNAANPLPTFSGGGVAGTFSSTAGLVFVSPATGQVNLAASIPGSYTVTNTIAASGGCSGATATSPLTISDLIWTGTSGTDWTVTGNWSCGFVPYSTSNVQIPDVANKPVINSGVTAEAGNITIENGSSLNVTSGTLMIYGSIISNSGVDASDGTVEFAGPAAQSVGNNIFVGNTVKNLTVNNNAGVTLQGPLNATGVVLVQSGTLESDDNLTLVSDATQTALIDGSGTGNVTGNVTMQRYLSPGFGYKYFSSPFQAATVSEFGDDMDLASSFPLFYRFNENHRASGWVSYTTGTNVLNPLAGYAVNFGAVAIPKTVNVMGEVNNGSSSVTLFNHDSTFTKGFNLVGNPYPSPVDWDAAGWTKVNIDTAVYYFKASATDEYGGTYSSYIKGISSDGFATNIIPSMQGFFVHVSDGTFPVTGTLGVSNSVRINDLTHPFLKSANSDDRFLLRATATFADDIASADPAVIYFDDGAQKSFDGGFDALKLMNTDMLVTNFYSVLTRDKKLSVNALPTELFDTTLTVPLGLMIYRDGEVIFKIKDLENRPGEINIYFRDAVTGSNINMLTAQDYRVVLNAGDYNNRFSLAFLKNATGIGDHPTSDRIFSAYESSGKVKATVNTISGGEGVITIYDMTGRPLYIKKVYETGYYEFDPGVRQGIYIIGFITGNQRCTLKLILGF